jgi:hypothetical protein
MKSILGPILAILYSGSVFAISDVGGCEKREYAEVKDTSTKELVEEYCYNEQLIRILGERFQEMLDHKAFSDAKKIQAAKSGCYEEQRRIETEFTSRRAKEPSCK